MKTFLLLLSMSIIIGNAQSQKTLTYEFNSLPIQTKIKVKYKEPLTIVINDINKKLYKIEDTKTATDFNIATPESLKGIKPPGMLFLTSLTPSKLSALPFEGSISREEFLENYIKSCFYEIKRITDRLNNAVLYYNQLNHLPLECINTRQAVLKRLNDITVGYLYPGNSGGYQITNFSQVLNDTLSYFKIAANKYITGLEDSINKYIDEFSHDLGDLKEASESNIEDIETDIKQPKLSKAQIAELNQKLRFEKRTLEEINDKQKSLEDNLKSDYKEAKDAVDNINTFYKDDKQFTIVNLYKTTSSQSFYTYTSDVILPEKDETIITITATPNEVNSCTLFDKKSAVFKLEAYGGLKLDFSAGIFFSGGNSTFLGNTYYYENVTDSTRKIIAAQRGKSLLISVGGLLHFYKRSPAMPKLAGSIGASTTTNLDEFNFHAAPSIIIGNKNRIILSAGITLKSSKILDQQLKTNVIYTKLQSPDEIPVVSFFPKYGYFFALSYNLNL